MLESKKNSKYEITIVLHVQAFHVGLEGPMGLNKKLKTFSLRSSPLINYIRFSNDLNLKNKKIKMRITQSLLVPSNFTLILCHLTTNAFDFCT